MDGDLAFIAAILYAFSYVPMFAAGETRSAPLKTFLFMVDFSVTIAAYVCLWYAMPTTWTSFFAVLGLFIAGTVAGKIHEHLGYDPYGLRAMIQESKAKRT